MDCAFRSEKNEVSKSLCSVPCICHPYAVGTGERWADRRCSHSLQGMLDSASQRNPNATC
eukprot:1915723-Amphidinium_carterae.1